jgi:hypothetical protein
VPTGADRLGPGCREGPTSRSPSQAAPQAGDQLSWTVFRAPTASSSGRLDELAASAGATALPVAPIILIE